MKKIIISAAVAAMCISAPASAMVDKYTPGTKKLTVKEDGAEFEIREANAPGNSVRLYISPAKVKGGEVNCLPDLGTVIPLDYKPSDLTKIAKYFGPEALLTSVLIDMDEQANFHDAPNCSTGKWGWVSVDVVQEGTAVYYVSGLKKDYEVRVTFGPDPENPGKTVVLQLQSHNKK